MFTGFFVLLQTIYPLHRLDFTQQTVNNSPPTLGGVVL